MSERIKHIEINDFRGFEGAKTFDIGDADLVVILGLNGFGKTSTFDAIEWCLTGKIGRYEDRYIEGGRKQDFNKEKEILRNKYAKNPISQVKITTSSGKKFGRRVLASTNSSDYGPGGMIEGCNWGLDSLCNESISTELMNSYFSATHLLSQDNINCFVTSKKPDERYKALSVNFGTAIFAPFEDNVQTLLSSITALEKELKKELRANSLILRELTAQLQDKDKNIEPIVEVASKLTKELEIVTGSVLHKALELRNNMVELDRDFSKNIKQLLWKSKISIESVENKLSTVKLLKENIEEWKRNNKNLNQVEKDVLKKKSLLKQISEYVAKKKREESDLKKILEEQESIEKGVKQIELMQKHIFDFQKNYELILKKESEARKNEKEALEAKNELPKTIERMSKFVELQNKVVVENERIFSFKSRMENKKEFIEGFAEMQSDKEIKLKRLKSGISNFAKVCSLIKQRLELFTERSDDYKGLQALMNDVDLDTFVEDPIMLDTIKSLLGNYYGYTDVFKKALAEKKEIDVAIEKTSEQLTQKRQIILDIIPFVNKEKPSCECPVCDTLFETNSFMKKLDEKLAKEGDKEASELKKKLEMTNDSLAKVERKIEENKWSVAAIAEKVEEYLENKVNLNKSKYKKMEIEYEKVKQEWEGNGVAYQTMESEYNIFFGKKMSEYEEVITELDRKLKKNNENRSELQKELDAVGELKKKYETKVNQYKEKQKSLQSEIVDLKDTNYQNVRLFCKDNALDWESSELSNEVDTLLKDRKLKLVKIKLEVDIKSKIIDQISNKLDDTPVDETPEKLEGYIEKKMQEIASNREFIYRMSEKCEFVEVNVAEYKQSTLNEKEKGFRCDIEKHQRVSDLSSELIDNIKTLEQFNLNKDLRTKVEKYREVIESNERKNDNLQNLKKRMTSIKKKFPAILKTLIEKNLDITLFNNIYRLLNPHRRFEMIDFEVDVSRNKVGISFNAKQSEIEARPELLFSTAQLNTFGICMFLAMSLRQNWLELDTILIDDPIQNLDDINILSFIDFMRGLLDTQMTKKQIIISTHDERFYNLLMRKFQGYKLKAFKFESYGSFVSETFMG